jgi:hypothetical protein
VNNEDFLTLQNDLTAPHRLWSAFGDALSNHLDAGDHSLDLVKSFPTMSPAEQESVTVVLKAFCGLGFSELVSAALDLDDEMELK